MSSQSVPLACRSLTKSFGGPAVVDDLTFEVAAGTITGFVGANGAGKTTTMRMLLGLVAPSSGAALVDGRPYRELAHPRRRVGAVVDGPGAHPAHTARSHLRIVATAAGLPLARVDEVLDLVELTGHAGRRVGGFSLGMRQRLALAGALLGDPGILVLDEPVNGLDPPGIVWVRDLLRRLAGEGRAILVSSHLLHELAEVAGRIVIIDRGRLVADTTLGELLHARSPVVEVRCAQPDVLVEVLQRWNVGVERDDDLLLVDGLSAEEVGEIIAMAGAGPVHRLAERATRFEDVYFELAGTLSAQAPTTASSGDTVVTP
jgi:ABC-2 type transport system ATP-binding protein